MATTPILSPGKPHGRRSLVAAVHVVAKTERLHFLSCIVMERKVSPVRKLSLRVAFNLL